MISVVMITMNEAAAVGKVIGDIQRVVPSAEVLIVDSSSDNTPQIAESMGVKVIRQFPPRGYGRAMDLALRSATGDVIVTMDCDDTYPADDIPRLAEGVLQDGYDVVDGSRLHRRPKAMPLINYAANVFFATLASLLFWRRITDLHSGMRAYRRQMIQETTFDPSGPALPVELLLRPLRNGCRVKFTFIEYRQRIGVSTMNPLPSAWWTLRRIMRARWGK